GAPPATSAVAPTIAGSAVTGALAALPGASVPTSLVASLTGALSSLGALVLGKTATTALAAGLGVAVAVASVADDARVTPVSPSAEVAVEETASSARPGAEAPGGVGRANETPPG